MQNLILQGLTFFVSLIFQINNFITNNYKALRNYRLLFKCR